MFPGRWKHQPMTRLASGPTTAWPAPAHAATHGLKPPSCCLQLRIRDFRGICSLTTSPSRCKSSMLKYMPCLGILGNGGERRFPPPRVGSMKNARWWSVVYLCFMYIYIYIYLCVCTLFCSLSEGEQNNAQKKPSFEVGVHHKRRGWNDTSPHASKKMAPHFIPAAGVPSFGRWPQADDLTPHLSHGVERVLSNHFKSKYLVWDHQKKRAKFTCSWLLVQHLFFLGVGGVAHWHIPSRADGARRTRTERRDVHHSHWSLRAITALGAGPGLFQAIESEPGPRFQGVKDGKRTGSNVFWCEKSRTMGKFGMTKCN